MKIFILAFLLSLKTLGFAHETYFSFAEMQYDTECNCLEITLTLSAHDLDAYADRQNMLNATLEKDLESEDTRQRLVQETILKGFKIKQNRQDIILFYEGYELFEDGTCSFYLRSEQMDATECTLFYGLFMDVHPEQQNKLNYKKEKDQVVYSYFVFKRENTIEL
tara:strand:+ start:512 stop:1006 length:495 start_codon:yes stop_codon:yes gene_type:complete